MNEYITVLKKYFVTEGRARRKEYLMFALIHICICLIGGVILAVTKSSLFSIALNLYQMAIIIPCITVGIRRMHDSDHKGWFLLVPIYSVYLLFFKPGTKGSNRFGEDPKTPSAPLATAVLQQQ